MKKIKNLNVIELEEKDFTQKSGELRRGPYMALLDSDLVLYRGHIVKHRTGAITARLTDVRNFQFPPAANCLADAPKETAGDEQKAAKDNEDMTEGGKFAKEWAEGMREASQKPPAPLQESYLVKHEDPELHAMDVCIEAMTRHLGKDAAARVRVLEYLHARLRLPKTP